MQKRNKTASSSPRNTPIASSSARPLSRRARGAPWPTHSTSGSRTRPTRTSSVSFVFHCVFLFREREREREKMRSRPEGKADRERRRKNPSKTPLPFFFKKNSLSSLLSLGRQAPRPLGGRPTARARPALARDAPGPGNPGRPRPAGLGPLDDRGVPGFGREAGRRVRFDGAPARGAGPSGGGGRVVRAEGGAGIGGGEEWRWRRDYFLSPSCSTLSFLESKKIILRLVEGATKRLDATSSFAFCRLSLSLSPSSVSLGNL